MKPTDEFNRYCAEVMGYEISESHLSGSLSIKNPNFPPEVQAHDVFYHPANNLNQMAKVFDKLWLASIGWSNDRMHRTQSNFRLSKGIAQAMREFIESTKEES